MQPVLRPSSAHRWAGQGCTQSTLHVDDGPRSRAAAEGTRLHNLAASVLCGDNTIDDLTDEDRAVLTVYLQHARGADYVEQKVAARVGPYLLAGTPDAVRVKAGHAEIIDLKTGWGIVEVPKNWQLICYALAWADRDPTIERYTLTIVQPRPWHPEGSVRSWDVTTREITRDYAPRIADAMASAYVSPRYRTGPACKYCPAIRSCSALRDETLADADHAGYRAQLPDDHLAAEIEALEAAASRIGLRLDALRESAIGRLRRGERIRGLTLRQDRGRLKWDVDDPAAIIEMLTGQRPEKKVCLTPKQAIDSGVPDTVISGLASRKPGKIELRHTHKESNPFK